MTDSIIIAIILIVLVAGVVSTAKHFRRKSGCCGSGDYRAKKKKLSRVVDTVTFTVTDMHCQHCVNRVMEAIQDIDGASASVNLKKASVTVSMSRPIDPEILKQAVRKAGYNVVY